MIRILSKLVYLFIHFQCFWIVLWIAVLNTNKKWILLTKAYCIQNYSGFLHKCIYYLKYYQLLSDKFYNITIQHYLHLNHDLVPINWKTCQLMVKSLDLRDIQYLKEKDHFNQNILTMLTKKQMHWVRTKKCYKFVFLMQR